MARLVGENEAALERAIGQDFKTASQEQVFETLACKGEVAFQKSQLEDWMAPKSAPVPRALAELSHQLPDIALIPYPVVSDQLRIEPWWSNGATTRLVLSEYLKYLAAKLRMQFDSVAETRALLLLDRDAA